jgi:hypothetical protein
MIISEFLDGQGLGNQLWTYAACRSIARRLAYPFSVHGKSRFKGAEFLNIDYGIPEEAWQDRVGTARPPTIFNERVFYDHELDYYASDFDRRVLDLMPITKLYGLFQSEEYFFGDPSPPRLYIELKEEYLKRALVDDDVCVLNLRGGEYKRHRNLVLPDYYWQMAMSNMRERWGINKFICVTDDRRYANALFPGMQVISGSVADCYAALHQASFLILSNSSFAYFPVKSRLSPPIVIAPSCWARFGNKFQRWASPANIYREWHWQDVHGKLADYETACELKRRTLEFYERDFRYLVSESLVKQRSARHLVPQPIRKAAKQILAPLFPKRFG